MSLDILPTNEGLGAEVRGVNLSRPMMVEDVEALKRAWNEHLVLLIRNQSITDSDLVRFSKYFGKLLSAPAGERRSAGYSRSPIGFPEIAIISNVLVNGVPIGSLGSEEAIWHTDMSYLEKPIMGALLYALEVPKEGGSTGFSNMYLAYEQIPSKLKTAMLGRLCIHDQSVNSAGYLRRGYEHVTDITRAPGARHPLFRTHPETGRHALFLGRRRNAYIVGMTIEESNVLLDAIWSHATKEEFTWHHQWRMGDLLMWDNRAVIHRREAFDNKARRIMHRTQIIGEKPFYALNEI